jgi:hypothetical protein
MKGTRIEIPQNDAPGFAILQPGEYGKWNGDWYCVPPTTGFGPGWLKNHTVVENPDGTITVTPSILMTGVNGKTWHGYLTNGEWREC